jgi:FlaA1/EpsC-like NDP-sugar epimerase
VWTPQENIEGWFQAGVSAVGIGSKLISTQLMTDKDSNRIGNKKDIGPHSNYKKQIKFTSMNSIFNLNGKVALITGGGGVLGSNMAIVLAKQGVITGIMGLTLEEAEATVARVKEVGGKALQLNLMCSTKKI